MKSIFCIFGFHDYQLVGYIYHNGRRFCMKAYRHCDKCGKSNYKFISPN